MLLDNLLFLYVEYISSASVAQQQLSWWCGLHCVPVLRLSSLCRIALCQGQLVTMYGFRSGWSSGFSSIPLPPSSFFIVFAILFRLFHRSFQQQSKQTRLYSDLLLRDPLKAYNVNRMEIFNYRQQSKHIRLYKDLLQRKLSKVKRCDMNRLCISRTLHIRHIQSISAFKPL